MALEHAYKSKRKKMKRRLFFRTITLLIILATVIYALIMNITGDATAVKKGEKAPDFELTQMNVNNDYEQMQLSQLEGKGVVINFWASYCEPCESQLLYMEALYEQYQDDIEFITINLDNSELVIEQYINKYQLSFPVMHDIRSEIMNMYDVAPIPTTFFISPNGEVFDEVVGSMSYLSLESYFKKILPNQGVKDLDG